MHHPPLRRSVGALAAVALTGALPCAAPTAAFADATEEYVSPPSATEKFTFAAGTNWTVPNGVDTLYVTMRGAKAATAPPPRWPGPA